jgi:hypothetical protein
LAEMIRCARLAGRAVVLFATTACRSEVFVPYGAFFCVLPVPAGMTSRNRIRFLLISHSFATFLSTLATDMLYVV